MISFERSDQKTVTRRFMSFEDVAMKDIIEREARAIFQTYTRQPLVIVRGSGARVWDSNGREYIDFVAGIAVNNVGHCHPMVVDAIKKQCELLIHTSNLYYTENQVVLAEELKSLTGMDKVFFCNSGTESVEAAIKLVRKATGRYEMVAATGSFHGRTMGSLGLTYKSNYREPFRPLNEAAFVPYNDAEALKSAVKRSTAGVILETVQGEAGVYVASNEYLRAARDICDDNGALLIFDEVQTGFGRTGRWFGKDHSGIMPDVMTLAKAIAGGLPMGAMLASESVSSCFQRGDHASTFGGGPLVCAAAIASITAIKNEKLVKRSEDMGSYLISKLRELPVRTRGLGLMVGVDIEGDARSAVDMARERGILLNSTGDRTLRLVPPLVVTEAEIDRVVDVLGEIL